MNRKYIFLIVLVIGVVLGFIFFYKNNNSKERSKYNAERTSQNIENKTNTDENTVNRSSNNIINNEIEQSQENEQINENSTIETEIASFTTKIYTKDSGRQNNITIACSTLNNTIVENGKTFSFSKTVGKATSGKGYKKADVFRNGDVIEALGGGLCQVSTTLYNAVLKIPEIKVTERHPHSNKVPYIKTGKDAAVSFRSSRF